MEDRCVSCGAIIPEGRQVCESCERGRFTGDEVIKALECCQIRHIEKECDKCTYHRWLEPTCRGVLVEDALALINRQRAEIERLQGALKAEERHNELTMEMAKKALANAKTEAIEEFAERLKEKMGDLSRMEYNYKPYFLVSKSFVDKIADEMKGGEPRKDVGE